MSTYPLDTSCCEKQLNREEIWGVKDTIQYEQMTTTKLSDDLWFSIINHDGKCYVNLNRKNIVKWGSRTLHWSTKEGITIRLDDFKKLQPLIKSCYKDPTKEGFELETESRCSKLIGKAFKVKYTRFLEIQHEYHDKSYKLTINLDEMRGLVYLHLDYIMITSLSEMTINK